MILKNSGGFNNLFLKSSEILQKTEALGGAVSLGMNVMH